MQTAAPASSPVQRGPGSSDAVLHDGGGRAPGVPHERVEPGDVHEEHVVAVGEGMPGGRGRAPRRVVLQVDGGHVASGRPPQPSRRQLGLLGALQHHDVDVGARRAPRARPRRRSAASPTPRACRRPRARARAASAAGSGESLGRTPSSTSRARARSRCSRGHLQGRAGSAATASTHGLGGHPDRGRDGRAPGTRGRASRGTARPGRRAGRAAPRTAPSARRGRPARRATRPGCRPPRPGAPRRCCRRRPPAARDQHPRQLREVGAAAEVGARRHRRPRR